MDEYYCTDAMREKMRIAKLGTKHSEETKQKIGESAKEVWQDFDYHAKACQERRKRWDDPVYRAKITQASVQRWQDPEYRARMSQMARERWQLRRKQQEKYHGS